MSPIERLNCLRCGHEWWPRSESKPVSCPKCHSPYWHMPRRAEMGQDASERPETGNQAAEGPAIEPEPNLND